MEKPNPGELVKEEPAPTFGAVVPDFYVDPDSLLLGCYVRPAREVLEGVRAEEERLVEELEAKMRPEPSFETRDWTDTLAALKTSKAAIDFKTRIGGVDWSAIEHRVMAASKGRKADFIIADSLHVIDDNGPDLKNLFSKALRDVYAHKPVPAPRRPHVFNTREIDVPAPRIPRVSYIEQFYEPTTGRSPHREPCPAPAINIKTSPRSTSSTPSSRPKA